MKKEITMSIHDFMEIQREHDINKFNSNLEEIASKILKNKKLRNIVITSTALINMNIIAYANENTVQAVQQIENAESQIVPVILSIVGALCTVCCIGEIGRSVITKKGSDIGQIITKYIIAFLGSCSAPWLFRLIRNMFQI